MVTRLSDIETTRIQNTPMMVWPTVLAIVRTKASRGAPGGIVIVEKSYLLSPAVKGKEYRRSLKDFTACHEDLKHYFQEPCWGVHRYWTMQCYTYTTKKAASEEKLLYSSFTLARDGMSSSPIITPYGCGKYITAKACPERSFSLLFVSPPFA